MTSLLTRRAFAASLSLAGAASLLPKSARAAGRQDLFSNANLGAFGQGILTQAHFESLVGSLFMVFLEDYSVDYMHLREVTAIESKEKKPTLTSFHLSFRTGGKVIPQGSYVLDHGRLGRFTLFLVPGQLPSGAPTVGATFASRKVAVKG